MTLSTAQELFARQGYRAVGIDTLLAEAGVAKMTLYKQFGSKRLLKNPSSRARMAQRH